MPTYGGCCGTNTIYGLETYERRSSGKPHYRREQIENEALNWNTRAPILSESELKKLEEIL